MLGQIEECVTNNESFAFETTLSGRGYINRIHDWRKSGYEVILYYFSVPSVEFAIERVKHRVFTGGHNIQEEIIRRRYERSLINFEEVYKPIVDSWVKFDTSENVPIIIETSENYI
jgi:predicted ABC-type ATPase